MTIVNPLSDNVQHTIEEVLAGIGHDANIACAALWKKLRPVTPSDELQFQAFSDMDRIMDKFDTICRRFVLPIDEIVDLRLSLSRVVELAEQSRKDVAELATNLDGVLSTASEKPVAPSVMRRQPGCTNPCPPHAHG